MNILLKPDNVPAEPGWHGCSRHKIQIRLQSIDGPLEWADFHEEEIVCVGEYHWGTGIACGSFNLTLDDFVDKYPHALFSDRLDITFAQSS